MNPQFLKFQKLVLHPIKFRFFLFKNLPSAWIAGLRITKFDTDEATISVSYQWLNQNPFRSIYFAVQSMAAEISTGMLAFGQIFERNPAISMLVIASESKFHKKATGTITFTCNEGALIATAVENAIALGEGQTIKCYSIGKNQAGEIVSEFWFVWSFKAKIK